MSQKVDPFVMTIAFALNIRLIQICNSEKTIFTGIESKENYYDVLKVLLSGLRKEIKCFSDFDVIIFKNNFGFQILSMV